MNQAQNNTKGIIFILIGMASFSIQDSLIKFIFNDTALYELYFGRTLVAALLLIIPGFFTDLIGFVLLIPFTRKIVFKFILKNKTTIQNKKENNIIDGEVIKKDKDEL